MEEDVIVNKHINKKTVRCFFWIFIILILVQSTISSAISKQYKLFKVTYTRQSGSLDVKIKTDLPDNTPLLISCTKTGLRDNDREIGCDSVNSIVVNGNAEARLNIAGLPKGSYELEVKFNSFWISRPATMEPTLQALIGEYGEHLQTPYLRNFQGYRMIDFKKIAFSISKQNNASFGSGKTGVAAQSNNLPPTSSAGNPSQNLFDSYGDVERDHKACSNALTSAEILYVKSTSAWEGAGLISECMERKGYTWDFKKTIG